MVNAVMVFSLPTSWKARYAALLVADARLRSCWPQRSWNAPSALSLRHARRVNVTHAEVERRRVRSCQDEELSVVVRDGQSVRRPAHGMPR
jgi:hypothetical protein